MFYTSNKPQVFASKEESERRITVEFDRCEHTNALRDEPYCPKEVYTEPACTKQIVVLCQTEDEALKTAHYHFYSTGSNFKIISNLPNNA